MNEITVVHQEDDAYAIFIRDHVLHVDQPRAGGYDSGPTPLELFAASLAACVAYYARHHLKDHSLPHTGLEVGTHFTLLAGEPLRVGSISLDVRLPWSLRPSDQEDLLKAIDPCPILASLDVAPKVTATVTCSPTDRAAEPARTPQSLH
ncbi:putative OsmC-like protein [Actinocorallia herbida]|uniref:Putative OsmC-like protein n=1 Tax=Actinocorallia herbida TaxID=58109 RepID=A0A3N1CZF5_9ACTN|nr:OsmC family protein [Actinocorallia herbida]ROO86670.1 putative OsmC-like protein [Actinocorallia herbida]